MHPKLHASILFGLLLLARAQPAGAIVPGEFGAPTILNFSSSPGGVLSAGVALTTQYSPLGALFDGHTITPPGPPGMSSLSGLPGLEAGSEGAPLGTLLRVDFTVPVREVGAFYLMGSPNNSITLQAFGANDALLQAVTILPADMTLHPGPFGYNEGFIGLEQNQLISYITFNSSGLPYAIDDLHFSPVPEPSALALAGAGALLAWMARRHFRRPRGEMASRD